MQVQGATAVAVGRQPIVDRAGDLIGYELLYRPVQPGGPLPSAEQMTADVVLGALTIGVGQLVGDKVIFCNAERGVFTGETPVTLPSHRTVIEVLETVAVDDEIIDGCADLVARGYRLALDDFTWFDGAERLLGLATIVKLDLQTASREELEALAGRCAEYDVLLLAEKIETADELEWAQRVGFDFFQGYAIEKPVVVRAGTIAPSVAVHVQLATSLLTEELDFDELERVLRREPGLVLQVLQLASVGADHGLRREVHSVREALVLLGTVQIRQWVALTLLSGRPGAGPDGLATALVRARTCELLATSRGLDPAFAFTAGLLSALDVLLGVPLAELAGTLDLPDTVAAAAFRQENEVGGLVAEVAAYESRLHAGTDAEGSGPQGDVGAAAAAAFLWAMPYVSAMAAAS